VARVLYSPPYTHTHTPCSFERRFVPNSPGPRKTPPDVNNGGRSSVFRDLNGGPIPGETLERGILDTALQLPARRLTLTYNDHGSPVLRVICTRYSSPPDVTDGRACVCAVKDAQNKSTETAGPAILLKNARHAVNFLVSRPPVPPSVPGSLMEITRVHVA